MLLLRLKVVAAVVVVGQRVEPRVHQLRDGHPLPQRALLTSRVHRQRRRRVHLAVDERRAVPLDGAPDGMRRRRVVGLAGGGRAPLARPPPAPRRPGGGRRRPPTVQRLPPTGAAAAAARAGVLRGKWRRLRLTAHRVGNGRLFATARHEARRPRECRSVRIPPRTLLKRMDLERISNFFSLLISNVPHLQLSEGISKLVSLEAVLLADRILGRRVVQSADGLVVVARP